MVEEEVVVDDDDVEDVDDDDVDVVVVGQLHTQSADGGLRQTKVVVRLVMFEGAAGTMHWSFSATSLPSMQTNAFSAWAERLGLSWPNS